MVLSGRGLTVFHDWLLFLSLLGNSAKTWSGQLYLFVFNQACPEDHKIPAPTEGTLVSYPNQLMQSSSQVWWVNLFLRGLLPHLLMTCKQLLLSCYSYFPGLNMATKCEIRLSVLKEKIHRKKKKTQTSKKWSPVSTGVFCIQADLTLKSKNWEREIEGTPELLTFLLAKFVTCNNLIKGFNDSSSELREISLTLDWDSFTGVRFCLGADTFVFEKHGKASYTKQRTSEWNINISHFKKTHLCWFVVNWLQVFAVSCE